MIIVMTNRNLPSVPQHKVTQIDIKELGVELGAKVDNENRLYTGEFLVDENNDIQYRKISFQPKGREANIFEKIADKDLKKPWVFFVHGFHQDPVENMDKAIALHDNHKVNVIVFAWPSRPLDETYNLSDAKQTVVKDLLTGSFGKFTLFKVAKDLALGYLKDTWNNYPPAILNAEKSNVDLMAAMVLVNKYLKSAKPPVLLVHSMGNYLLENTLKRYDELPMKFSRIMLHQADVTAPDYGWVKQLKLSLLDKDKSRLYITSNRDDYVLLSSKLRRVILIKQGELNKSESTDRLGRYVETKIDADFYYVDFTGGEFIDSEHEFFKLPKAQTNSYVFNFLDNVFKAKDDGLPKNMSDSNAGFSKMPVAHDLYRLEYVFHPADEDEVRNDILEVKSLDEYTHSDVGRNWEEDY